MIRSILLGAVLSFAPLFSGDFSKPQDDIRHRVLYLIQTGHIDQAIELYKNHEKATGRHDFELLENIGLSLLDQGYKTGNPEIQLLTLYGAGISANERALYILQDGIGSSSPEQQMIALNFLSRFQNDRADESVMQALRSDNLLVRLEAAFHLCEKKHPKAVAQTESLMSKVPPELYALFPQLFALDGSEAAIRVLKRLLANPIEDVRIEAILSAAKHQRDDLLPKIRILSSHHDIRQQEATSMALGRMKDEQSAERLEKLAQSGSSFVRLAASRALYCLGRKEAVKSIEEMAKNGDVFAITILGDIEEAGQKTLQELVKSPNLQIRINAALALVEKRDSCCLNTLKEILIKGSKDIGISRIGSPGNALFAWKAIPSSKQNWEDNPIAFELSLTIREDALIKALKLKESEFLELANLIFECHQNDLVPLLTDLLRNVSSEKSIALLKKHQQKAGAPLIRNYCNLALFKMKEPGPWKENLQNWILKQKDVDLIRFRTFLPWEVREAEVETPYQLTPEDTSRLLVDSFEALAASQDDKDIDILLTAIQNGNPKNKYALAGLLIRAVQ